MSDIQISLSARNSSNCKIKETTNNTSAEELLSRSITLLNNNIQNLIANHPCSGIRTPATNSFSFMLKMWTHLLEVETDYPYRSISVRESSATYTGDEITYFNSAGNHRNPLDYFPIRSESSRNTFNVYIMQVKRGLDMIGVFHEQAAEWDLKPIPELNMHVTMHARHRINVYEMPENKGILIITNNKEESMISRILGSVWCCLDMFGIKEKLRATNIAESKFLQFCKILYDEDLAAYHLFVDTITAEYEAYYNSPEYLTEQLKGCQTATQDQRKNSVLQYIENTQRDIRNYEDSIISAYNNLREYELKLMAMTLSNSETDQSILDLIVFLQKAKNTVKLIKVNKDEGTMVLEITTPLNTYRRKDVEMYYKHPDTQNHVNRYPLILEAFQKTFIDEEYDMITTTRITLSMVSNNSDNGSARGVSDYAIDNHAGRSDAYLRFGNPHIERHNCFSGSKREIDKALANSDYVMAISQLISACSSITFTDSTVVSSFTTRIAKTDNNTPIFKRRSDGEMLSLEQLHAECKPKDEDYEEDE